MRSLSRALANMFPFQPRPLAAIDLIHKQPVRWSDKSSVSCDGGGGPLGHPRIFINLNKPQICWCTYCGVPYVRLVSSEHVVQSDGLQSLTIPGTQTSPQGTGSAAVH